MFVLAALANVGFLCILEYTWLRFRGDIYIKKCNHLSNNLIFVVAVYSNVPPRLLY